MRSSLAYSGPHGKVVAVGSAEKSRCVLYVASLRVAEVKYTDRSVFDSQGAAADDIIQCASASAGQQDDPLGGHDDKIIAVGLVRRRMERRPCTRQVHTVHKCAPVWLFSPDRQLFWPHVYGRGA